MKTIDWTPVFDEEPYDGYYMPGELDAETPINRNNLFGYLTEDHINQMELQKAIDLIITNTAWEIHACKFGESQDYTDDDLTTFCDENEGCPIIDEVVIRVPLGDWYRSLDADDRECLDLGIEV